jgi:L-asparaginase
MGFSSSFSASQRPGVPPLEVRLLRGGSLESVHRVHAVVCDQRGRVLMRAGDPQRLSFMRSALKPFQAQVFVASGAADQPGNDGRSLAIACAYHAGTLAHAREAFKLLWNAHPETHQLQCPDSQGRHQSLGAQLLGKTPPPGTHTHTHTHRRRTG